MVLQLLKSVLEFPVDKITFIVKIHHHASTTCIVKRCTSNKKKKLPSYLPFLIHLKFGNLHRTHQSTC